MNTIDRAAQQTMSRGLVLIPDVKIDVANGSLGLSTNPEKAVRQVKQGLPYWDFFDLPDNRIISTGIPEPLQELHKLGIVQKSEPDPGPIELSNVALAWVEAQLATLQKHEVEDPGVWSLSQEGSTVWLPPHQRVSARCIESTLYGVLPVPGDDVSFEEILDFKLKRRDELAALRAEMDSLYLSIISQADIPRATSAATDRLVKCLADLDKVATQSWSSKLMSSVTAEITVGETAAGAIAGMQAANQFQFPILIGAAAGAAGAAFLKFKLKATGAKTAEGKPFIAYAREVTKI